MNIVFDFDAIDDKMRGLTFNFEDFHPYEASKHEGTKVRLA